MRTLNISGSSVPTRIIISQSAREKLLRPISSPKGRMSIACTSRPSILPHNEELMMKEEICLGAQARAHILSVGQPQVLPTRAGDSLRQCIPSEKEADDEFQRGSDRLHQGLDLPALVEAAASAINNPGQPSVRVIDKGFCNKIFQISFQDGPKLLARVPLNSTARLPQRIESEVATMTFVRYYLAGVPVAKVHAWNSTSDNPVGAPYVILDYVEGEQLEFLWHRLSEEDKDHVLQEVAAIYSHLSQPLPFNRLGNIMFNTATTTHADISNDLNSLFRIGPIIIGDRFYARGQHDVERPQTSVQSLSRLWQQLYEFQCAWLVRRWGPLDPESNELLDPEDEYDEAVGPKTYGHMSRAAYDVKALLASCAVPEDYAMPTLSLADFAFRNIIYDENSKRITGLIDWEEAHVLPFIVAVRYPDDISSWWGAPSEWWTMTGGIHSVPPDEFPETPAREDDEFRVERLAHTRYRARWRELLARLDPRFPRTLWDRRVRPAKAHSLAVDGAYSWLARRNWIHKYVRGEGT